jgi:hypothetical protein
MSDQESTELSAEDIKAGEDKLSSSGLGALLDESKIDALQENDPAE